MSNPERRYLSLASDDATVIVDSAPAIAVGIDTVTGRSGAPSSMILIVSEPKSRTCPAR